MRWQLVREAFSGASGCDEEAILACNATPNSPLLQGHCCRVRAAWAAFWHSFQAAEVHKAALSAEALVAKHATQRSTQHEAGPVSA